MMHLAFEGLPEHQLGENGDLPMRLSSLIALLILACASGADAQLAGKFPPASLINTQVIPRTTPVIQVIGTMRNFAGDLGVRCQFFMSAAKGSRSNNSTSRATRSATRSSRDK